MVIFLLFYIACLQLNLNGPVAVDSHAKLQNIFRVKTAVAKTLLLILMTAILGQKSFITYILTLISYKLFRINYQTRCDFIYIQLLFNLFPTFYRMYPLF